MNQIGQTTLQFVSLDFFFQKIIIFIRKLSLMRIYHHQLGKKEGPLPQRSKEIVMLRPNTQCKKCHNSDDSSTRDS